MTVDRITLGEFERRHGVHKGTVSKRARERGFDTSAGLSPDAYQAMKQEFGVKVTLETPTEPAASGLSIHAGNHCTTLAAPGFDGMTIDLGQFRDSSALVIDDPLAVAEQFLQTADLIQGALADDIADREQRLARTKQAQAKIATKAQELALEQRLYRLQAAQLDTATTDETKALADALQQLQSLGKPAVEADASA